MKKLKKIQLVDEVLPSNLPVAAESQSESETDKKGIRQFSDLFQKIKVKPFPWKHINARSALIAGCLVIIAIAGYLNIRYAVPIQNHSGTVTPASESDAENYGNFFASAVIDRERARGEALEVLVGITEDEGAGDEARANAFEQMERIANETSWEIDIENLVKAKGFQECVAIIGGDSANIVVRSDGLTPGEIAQIKEIVYLESSINPKDVKIIEKGTQN